MDDKSKAAAKSVADKKAVKKEDAPKAVLVKDQDYQPLDLYSIELKRPEKKGYGVQVSVMSSQDALFRKVAELQGDWFDNILVSVEENKKGDPQYKIILGPFKDEATAQSYKDSLKKKKKMEGFVVNLGPEKAAAKKAEPAKKKVDKKK